MITLLLLACTDPAPAPVDTAGPDLDLPSLSADLVDGFVRPRGADFTTRADALRADVAAFCEAPDATTLGQAQQAWKDARRPWKSLEVVNFGPDTEEPYRIGPKVDFWPARPDRIEATLASGAGLSPADMDAMGGATRGLPALEVLLFADAPSGDPLTALATDPRRCEYATALAGDVHALAARYVDAWDDDWRARLVDPAATDDDDFDTDRDVLDEWVNRMAFTIEDLRYERLGKPMGDAAGGSPQPDTLESPYSGAALRDVADILDGVDRVFHGDGGLSGIASRLDVDSPVIPAFDQRMGLARDALLVVPEPLAAAIVDHRPQVAALQEALRDLQLVIQLELAQELSVTVVFNDNDGD